MLYDTKRCKMCGIKLKEPVHNRTQYCTSCSLYARRTKKKQNIMTASQEFIDDDIKNADKLGVSYGKYMADKEQKRLTLEELVVENKNLRKELAMHRKLFNGVYPCIPECRNGVDRIIDNYEESKRLLKVAVEEIDRLNNLVYANECRNLIAFEIEKLLRRDTIED